MGLFTFLRRRIQPCLNAYERFLIGLSNRNTDLDRLCSYYTRQQVLFLDWKLGLTYWSIQIGMAIVVVGYVLLYCEGYVAFEQAKGSVVTHVAGDALSISQSKPGTRYFSAEDLTYPGLENGNVFVATRQTVHKQARGICEDPDMPCVTDSDCTGPGDSVCTDSGLCRTYHWCDVEEAPEIYEMAADNLQIWPRSFIQFVKHAPTKIFTTDYPNEGPTAGTVFSVRQLLAMVDPLPIHYEEISMLGAIFEVGLRWECNIFIYRKSKCLPQIHVRRLDTLFDPDNIGYSFKYAEYVDEEHRVENKVNGVRFLFKTTGVGKKFSVSSTITTLSTAGTILSLAIVVTDLLLTKVSRHRLRFIARKFENTPDFSDYIEDREVRMQYKVKLIEVDKAEQAVVDEEAKWMVRFYEENV